MGVYQERVVGVAAQADGIGQRSVQGAMWLVALKVAAMTVNIVRTPILAWLLLPEDYGIVAIATLAISLTETFTQTGMQAAIIQRKGDVSDFLDTAWTIIFLRGILLCGLMYLIAPAAAMFMNSPKSVDVLKLLSLTFLINGTANVGIILLQRELNYGKYVIYELCGILLDVAITITAALILKNFWALAMGILSASITKTIVSYIVHPFRPRLRLRLRNAKELFRFGRWITITMIVTYFTTQGDIVFIGKFLGTTMLGYYALAQRIASLPAVEISRTIGGICFPMYSRLQDDRAAIKKAFFTVVRMLSLTAIPLSGIIFSVSPLAVKVLFGEKWLPMVPTLRVLCFFGLTRTLNVSMAPLITAKGKPQYLTALITAQMILIAGLIFPLSGVFGLLGVGLTITIANALGLIGVAFFAFRLCDIDIIEVARLVSIQVAVSAMCSLITIFTDSAISIPDGVVKLVVVSSVYCVCALLFTFLADRVFGMGMFDTVREIAKRAFARRTDT